MGQWKQENATFYILIDLINDQEIVCNFSSILIVFCMWKLIVYLSIPPHASFIYVWKWCLWWQHAGLKEKSSTERTARQIGLELKEMPKLCSLQQEMAAVFDSVTYFQLSHHAPQGLCRNPHGLTQVTIWCWKQAFMAQANNAIYSLLVKILQDHIWPVSWQIESQ